MKKILLALALCLLPVVASAQCTGVFVAGRVCGSLLGGVPQPVPFTSFVGTANANTVYAGPTTGPAAAPTFRSLVGADLPLPTAVTLGAVFSKTAVASNWLRSLGTDGIFTASQPSFADLSGSITLAQFPTQAADTVLGRWAAGTGVPSATAVPDCSGALNYSTTTHLFSCNTSSIPAAPDQVANCSLAATVSANALTIALKDQTGADPSSISPCTVAFRSATITTGTYTSVAVTSALSFSTGTTGSTFGSTNGVAFRLWITAWNNAGTLVLGVSSQSTTTTIFPLDEGNVQSSTACSACTTASAAGTFYTTAAQTSKAIRILGYMDWGSGLGTAGVWATGPTTIQLFGQGVNKPGEVVRSTFTTSATSAAAGANYTPSNTLPTSGNAALCVTAPSYTPTANPNHVRITSTATGGSNTANSVLTGFVHDGSTAIALAGTSMANSAVALGSIPIVYESINPISAKTYSTYINGNVGTNSSNAIAGGSAALWAGLGLSFIRVEEIMG